MALTGIYNSNDREIVLTPFQAQIFNQTIQYFKTNGVGGDNVFEDTYVLQKRVAEYIKQNVTTSGGSASSFVNQVYNGVLGITPVAPPPPPPPPPPNNGGDFTDDTSDDISGDVVIDVGLGISGAEDGTGGSGTGTGTGNGTTSSGRTTSRGRTTPSWRTTSRGRE